MKTQLMNGLETLEAGQARHLGRLGGELRVLGGRIWLTRNGQRGDHFLEAGDTVQIGVDEYAVIESAFRGRGANLRWLPRRQSVLGRILAEPLLGLAFVARLAARATSVLAARVGTAARQAQGCIDRGQPR
ncbi:MAG: DUF2917 domain-containing protein [Pseudomonadota bacterium]|nr:DUF2917 domain-containing protein [Pseudomonadota bacterium]